MDEGAGERVLGDRYQVLSSLGAGGMATVELAWDMRLDRHVVIKIPHAHLLKDSVARERFTREIRSMTNLSHPHIVKVLDAGEDGGLPFVVLEYFEGGSLRDLLDEKATLTLEETLEWLQPIAQALDHVHEEGVVHRDIKPDNILFDGKRNVFLSDFGIAKALGNEVDSDLTQTGMAPGSPGYMGPEIFQGTIGPGYDQFALARVVAQCLTGEQPEAFRYGWAGRAMQPLPLPGRATEAICMALSTDTDARFVSCAAFVAALASATTEEAAPPADSTGTIVTDRTGAPIPTIPPLETTVLRSKEEESRAPILIEIEPRGRPVWPLVVVATLVALLVVVYFLDVPGIFGRAEEDTASSPGMETGVLSTSIVLDAPTGERTTGEAVALISGHLEGERRGHVTVGGVIVTPDEDGRFSTTVPLDPGKNEIDVIHVDEQGQAGHRVLCRVIRSEEAPPSKGPDSAASPYREMTLTRFRRSLATPDWTAGSPAVTALGNLRAVHARTGLVFILVPAGRFVMGSAEGRPEERPAHPVTVEAFLLSSTECTQEAWDRVGGADARKTKGPRRPVERVSWEECRAWCEKAGLRLPGEAESEYACRADGGEWWRFRHDEPGLAKHAWFASNAEGRTHDVGDRLPNGWGFHDLFGNVSEWCADRWHASYVGAPQDGSVWDRGRVTDGRVVRGGSYLLVTGDAHPARRRGMSPDRRLPSLGFRPAASLSD